MYISGWQERWINTEELTALEWTTEKPSQCGWYWVVRKYWNKPELYHVESLVFVDLVHSVTHWLGPVAMPEPPKR